MNEILYAVNVKTLNNNNSNVTVVATLEREANGYYIYKPHNLDKDNVPRAVEVIKTKGLPSIASRRLYSRRRPDIQTILHKYGLSKYDSWELLKRTKGKLATDNIIYLTENELNQIKNNPTVVSFVGIDK